MGIARAAEANDHLDPLGFHFPPGVKEEQRLATGAYWNDDQLKHVLDDSFGAHTYFPFPAHPEAALTAQNLLENQGNGWAGGHCGSQLEPPQLAAQVPGLIPMTEEHLGGQQTRILQLVRQR